MWSTWSERGWKFVLVFCWVCVTGLSETLSLIIIAYFVVKCRPNLSHLKFAIFTHLSNTGCYDLLIQAVCLRYDLSLKWPLLLWVLITQSQTVSRKSICQQCSGRHPVRDSAFFLCSTTGIWNSPFLRSNKNSSKDSLTWPLSRVLMRSKIFFIVSGEWHR